MLEPFLEEVIVSGKMKNPDKQDNVPQPREIPVFAALDQGTDRLCPRIMVEFYVPVIEFSEQDQLHTRQAEA